ncbi:MAG: 2-amino-4-hydroxy-6-hydroxymethyldihydropteridine diphosphokinase [Bacteroidales bacterium]
MDRLYLLLGSNQNNREALLQTATEQIKSQIGDLIQCSSIYETEPWGFKDDMYFLNQVVVFESGKPPLQILDQINEVEKKLGRKRENVDQYTSRPIDVDILFYGNRIYNMEQLKIPHPLIQERRFALVPMVEIEPDFVHPQLQRRISALLDECPDPLEVHRYK